MSTPDQPRFRALLLEDDAECATVCEVLLGLEGATVDSAKTIAEATSLAGQNSYDLFILDHNLPDGKGGELFYRLKEKNGDITAVMLTGVPELNYALELTRNGLFGYITKPFSSEQFLECIRRALIRIPALNAKLAEEFVGNCEPMREVHRMIAAAGANPEATVLILGETGVGKDLCARMIHKASFESDAHPFVNVNCATIPADMFEAELFGAEKGAYTGAHQARNGLVEAAEVGTLFLDEVAEVPLSLQPKLLQLLETRQYRRLGSTFTRTFRGRIISATNRPLDEEVQKGTFRADLFFRLDVLSFQIPPLRERKNDIPALAEYTLKQLCEKYGRAALLIRPDDLALLQSYNFPGNIRELRNILERSVVKTPDDNSWLQVDKARFAKLNISSRTPVPTAPIAAPHTKLRPASRLSLKQTEYQLLKEALAIEKGAIRKAAARLGISHQALLRRLEKWPELRTST
jgi:DNA-binding NtrC family response regulator